MRHFQILTLLATVALISLGGCATKEPEKIVTKPPLHILFEQDFRELKTPGAETIRAAGAKRSFPYASVDQVWEAVIVTMMQEGVIVHSSKETGVMVVIPNEEWRPGTDYMEFEMADGDVQRYAFDTYIMPIAVLVAKGPAAKETAISVYVCPLNDLKWNIHRFNPADKKTRNDKINDKIFDKIYDTALPENMKVSQEDYAAQLSKLQEDSIKAMNKLYLSDVLDKVAVQLYSGEKWKYLSNK